MRVGILGSGLMGVKLGTLFAHAGHEVVFSYARSKEKLKATPPSLVYCGDKQAGKNIAATLIRDVGFRSDRCWPIADRPIYRAVGAASRPARVWRGRRPKSGISVRAIWEIG